MSRRRDFFLPAIALDRASPVSLHRQIYRQIARAIRSGAIHANARLPSTRWMAGLLGVSRNTVLAAYDDLAAEDLVRGERGAGMRVTAGKGNGGGLRHAIRQAHYPARVLALPDQDGNLLYINF